MALLYNFLFANIELFTFLQSISNFKAKTIDKSMALFSTFLLSNISICLYFFTIDFRPKPHLWEGL